MEEVERDVGVNAAWEMYVENHGEISLNRLLSSMTSYANAIVWHTMRERRPDVVNDCLLRALKGLPRFREESKFSTWFHRIVVNRCKTVQRVEGIRRSRETHLDDIRELTGGFAWTEEGFEQWLESQKFSVEEKNFVRDKFMVGYDDGELGIKYELSLSGVRSRWRRIKEKLRRMM